MKNIYFVILLTFIFKPVCSQNPIILDLSLDFEQEDTLLYIDTTLTENLWEIGTPTKLDFDSAYSAYNAICTDLDSNYSLKNKSSFYISIVSNEFATGKLEFVHKYETDLGNAGGYIDISYDQGTSWSNLMNVDNYWIENFYGINDSICNREPGFTGSSNGWLNATVYFHWYIGLKKENYFPPNWGWFNHDNPDTLMIRYNFISNDSAIPRSGWIIDDIKIQIYSYTGISEKLKIDTPIFYYQPYERIIKIKTIESLRREYAVTIYDLSGKARIVAKNSPSTINVDNLETGIYILSINTKDGFAKTEKIAIF